VPFTRATELGRRVRLDDWRGFHRDRLLKVLYQLRELCEDGGGLTTEQISGVTGLDLVLVGELIESMTSQLRAGSELIEVEAARNVWRIAPRGVRWAEESPKSPAAGLLQEE